MMNGNVLSCVAVVPMLVEEQVFLRVVNCKSKKSSTYLLEEQERLNWKALTFFSTHNTRLEQIAIEPQMRFSII